MNSTPRFVKAKTEISLERKLMMLSAKFSLNVISIQKVGEFWFCWYYGEFDAYREISKAKAEVEKSNNDVSDL